MNWNYEYLFPFEKIPHNSKILIYGAGLVGQEYLKQIQISNYCQVIGFIDRAFDRYQQMIVPIYSPDVINKLKYDYIVLAFQTEGHVDEVRQILFEKYVEIEKIIYIPPRNECSVLIDNKIQEKDVSVFAFKKKEFSIALRYGPSLGDNIMRKKVFEEIIRLVPECLIDIYSAASSKDLQAIYGKCPNINHFIDDGGGIYEESKKNYALAMSVFLFIQVDNFDYDKVSIYNLVFAEKMKLLQKKCDEYKMNLYTPLSVHIKRQIYRRNNYYTALSYDGVFDIKDQNVKILLDKKWESKFYKLNLNKYITINYGNGIAVNHEHLIAKQWPYRYFNLLVKYFKKEYPQINIVQLGVAEAKKIESVDEYILGQNLELVKYVLKNSLFHLDIEGGLVHLATQLGTKCVVLFGPTQEKYFGYDQNINVISKKCGGCYGLYKNVNKCARNFERPECMYSITPEMVMEKIKSIL
jgi:ADP-heptose:LPS heptosyltransferase